MKQEWNHGYTDKHGNFIEYEKRWYCNHNKVIHGLEKEFNNCKENYERTKLTQNLADNN